MNWQGSACVGGACAEAPQPPCPKTGGSGAPSLDPNTG